jgi:Probable transposase.
MLKVVIESKDYRKRYLKIDDYLHKTSIYIINGLIENQIEILVIGNNPNWKQGINLGKKPIKILFKFLF